MATKSFFVYLKKINFFIFLLPIVFSSCASLKDFDFRPRSSKESGPYTGTDQKPYSDEEIEEDGGKSVDTKQVLGRKDGKPFRPKLAIILGPGLARSFAHVGFLKRLKEAGIPIQAIVGMGWGSFAAHEYSSEGSVHGLEWRLSRSTELQSLTKTSLWSSEIKPKSKSQVSNLVSTLLSRQNSKGPLFGCSLMSGVIKKVKIGGKKNIADCVAVPPLLDSGSGVAPYLMDVKWISDYLKSRGINKIIFVNVLSRSTVKWGEASSKMRSSEKWYWNFVENSLSQQNKNVDHVFSISTSSFGMLDFSKTLELVRTGYKDSEKIIKFLQDEYQF